MNHWPFIAAAYTLTLIALVSIFGANWRAMRRAETRAQALGEQA